MHSLYVFTTLKYILLLIFGTTSYFDFKTGEDGGREMSGLDSLRAQVHYICSV